jgi:malto-oligosyltrehalose synthase/4-alpha-glucanotransferase
MFNPISTYRFQFHKGFTLKQLEDIIPYLQKLGVKTIYASPIFEATPGSTHGYDALNANKINPEVGDDEQLHALSKKLKAQGLRWLQDIVPNHMAFDPRNPWLRDVLEKGRQSIYANHFDILWEAEGEDSKLMVPFLGASLQEVINNNELNISVQENRLVVGYFETYYPLNFRAYRSVLKQVNDAMSTRLVHEIDKLVKVQDQKKLAARSHQFEDDFAAALENKSFMDALPGVIEKINGDKRHLQKLVADQHYRLAHWQETDQQINYRRFFTVNGLICLNIQDEEVFEQHHQLIRSLVEQGVFHGLRVDHIDGLFDPTTYLQRLHALGGPETFISVEKILEPGESLPDYWTIQGSTGYDFLSLVNNLFTNQQAEESFTDYYHQLVNDNTSINQQIHDKKAHILFEHMGGELENLYQLASELQLVPPEIDKLEIKRAIGEFLIQCPVYRYYANMFPLVGEEAEAITNIISNIKTSKPELQNAAEILEEILVTKPAGDDEAYRSKALRFYQRCMQFTGPLMAKGVEDTLMYTYNRFIGHNEVGDSPESFGMSIASFHHAMNERKEKWPLAQNTTSTHDTKRGEDVRARLNVLTDVPDEWLRVVQEWKEKTTAFKTDNAPSVNDEYFIYQTIVGTHPMPGEDEDNFTERVQEYLQKALREAKVHSNWTSPNEAYETATKQFAVSFLQDKNTVKPRFQSFLQRIADHGIINSLSQLLLKFTCPGVPDVYQGTEVWDLSLVDPDNRRPVDYNKRRQWLDEIDNFESLDVAVEQLWKERYNGKIKLWMTAMLLNERKRRPDVFSKGEYVPVQVDGVYKENVLAFIRKFHNNFYLVAVPLHTAALAGETNDFKQIDWQDTSIILPKNTPTDWQDVMLDRSGKSSGSIKVQELFTSLPFAFLKLEKQNARGAGILLHISSLPSAFGIGDLGPEAKAFANFLHRSRQKYWQLLPLNPTEQGQGHSPYSALSSMAGNPLLISPEMLMFDSLLSAEDLHAHYQQNEGKTDYTTAETVKASLFEIAYQNYREQKPTNLQKLFDDFCDHEANWLEDFALYMVLKKHHEGKPWFQWKEEYKLRDEAALDKIRNHEYYEYSKIKWLQFMFARQWKKLKKYCNKRGIQFIGDLPFYVSYDSSDVWSHRHLFAIDDEGKITSIAGVPPDAFSEDGQLWGMPIFNWNAMKESGYSWWIERLRKNIEQCDIVRLDHFRAFAGYWDVPATETTAKNGEWKTGPGSDFFNALKKAFGELPFVAEDLGEITEDVLQLRDEFNLPGMKILQFAFDESMPASDYIPHNYNTNFLVYTGTHDNNTIRGWYRELTEESKDRLNKYTGRNLTEDDIPWVMARLAYASVARIAILPIQDVLGLDEIARMNMPGSGDNNWQWRLLPGQITDAAEQQLQEWTWLFNRE